MGLFLAKSTQKAVPADLGHGQSRAPHWAFLEVPSRDSCVAVRTFAELCLGQDVLSHPHRDSWITSACLCAKYKRDAKGSPADGKQGSTRGLNDGHCKSVEKARAQAACLPAVARPDGGAHGTFPARRLMQPSVSLSYISLQGQSHVPLGSRTISPWSAKRGSPGWRWMGKSLPLEMQRPGNSY